MRKLLLSPLVALALILVPACESLDRMLPPDTTDDDDGMVGTLAARDYYEPFFYDLHTRHKALLQPLADAVQSGNDDAVALFDNRYPGISLFVIGDGSFYLEYVEGRGGGYNGVTVLGSVMLQGAWNIRDGVIELGDLAVVEPSARNENALDLRFFANVLSMGLADMPIVLTPRGPEEQGDDHLFDTLLKKHGLRKVPPRPVVL
jgi:hypothetical protein